MNSLPVKPPARTFGTAADTGVGESNTKSRIADLALCAWFILTGVAFWGPYAGVALPFNILTALYAAFLLVFIADAALRLLRAKEPTPAPAPASQGERRRGK